MEEKREKDPRVAKLAYQVATKRLKRQEVKLAEIRQRTTTLVGATAIAMSFLANAVLGDHMSDLSVFSYVGLAAAGVAAFCSIKILLPTRARKLESETDDSGHGWKFSPNVEHFIDYYYKGDYVSEEGGKAGQPHTLAQTQADLVLRMAGWHKRNNEALNKLYDWFLWASVAVGVCLVAWVIDLVFIIET